MAKTCSPACVMVVWEQLGVVSPFKDAVHPCETFKREISKWSMSVMETFEIKALFCVVKSVRGGESRGCNAFWGTRRERAGVAVAGDVLWKGNVMRS